jgi:hypothetical protein
MPRYKSAREQKNSRDKPYDYLVEWASRWGPTYLFTAGAGAPERVTWGRLRFKELAVISGPTELYVGTAEQPVLIVHDLKRGSDAHGTVGLFVDNGTDGHFRNLSIRPQ